MEPETSVIIPIRNGAKFVTQAIASVLTQLGESDEVLAVDDGSTDETPAVLTEIVDPRLRRLASGGRGVSAARNLGLANASGEIVAFLDHDDLWPAGRHRELKAALKQDEALDVVFGRIACLLEPDARTTTKSLVDGHHACWLVGSGLYRRRLVDRIGGFAEDLQAGEDVDFHLRLTEAGMRARLCEVDGLVRRQHDSNMTNNRALAIPTRLNVLRRKLARARAPAKR